MNLFKKNTESYDKPGSSTWKMGLKIFGYSFLAGVMSIFVSFSIGLVAEGLLTEEVGYYEYEVVNEETNETTILNKVLFAETTTTVETTATTVGETTVSETTVTETVSSGDTTVMSDGDAVTTLTEAMAITTTTKEPLKVKLFEPKTPAAGVALQVVDVFSQVLLLVMFVTLTGYYVYREGDRDRNLVKHHRREPSPWRGLQIGLLAAIPSAVILLLPFIGKCGVMSDSVLGVYNFFNPTFLPIINVLVPTTVESATELGVLQLGCMVLMWTVLPVTGAVSYILGYKRVFNKPKKKKKS